MSVRPGVAPFHLTPEDCRWVEETLSGMDTDERLSQLFCLVTYTDDEAYCRHIAEDIRPGGFLCRRMPAESCRLATERMQRHSRIPLLVAANLESGGQGAAEEGTPFAPPMAIAATADARFAADLGRICGEEGRAVGINWSFAPVMDLDRNWRNPITNTRTFGSDPKTVAEMGAAYIHTLESTGVAASAKHFPGDGCDERDQHIAPSVNDLSPEEWDRTYGRCFSAAIAAGVRTVMIGHILLPAYVAHLAPDDPISPCLPASVNPLVIEGLLRKKLGFDGLVVTDSTVMAGVAALLPRERLVPESIAAGCDMFLFTKNLEEDLFYMREGYRRGILTPERLKEAVTRILSLKASLGLHRRQKEGTLVPRITETRAAFGRAENAARAAACADAAITLVRGEPGVLPLTPERYPRVLFYSLEDTPSGESIMESSVGVCHALCEGLRREGFSVTEYRPTGRFEGMQTPVRETVENYDLILYAAAYPTRSNQTAIRIDWEPPMGSNVPVYCHTVPTVFVSLENPYHLVDVPQMRTYINCYASHSHFREALIKKLMGRSPFRGISPVDPTCGKWEVRALGGEG